jgi:hypothetical protein
MAGLPGGGGQLMFIEGRWVDKASPEFKKTMAKMKGTASTASKQMGGMVNEQMGRSMSQFNEKTEKGRQLLTAFGGAAGGAAGNVVYYTGTLSYVVGRFTKMELGIMGALAAATALGFAFYKLATQDMQKVIEAAKKIRGELNTLNKAARDAVDAELYKLAGVGQWEQKRIELKKKWGRLSGEVAQGEAEIAKHLQQGMKAQIGSFFAAKATREELTKSKKELRETEETLERINELLKLKEDLPPELAPITEDKPKGKKKTGEGFALSWDQAEEDRLIADAAMKAALDYSKAWEDQQWAIHEARRSWEIEEERAQEEHLARLYDLREQHEEDVARMAEEKLQNQLEVVQNSIGIFSELADVVTQGEKANTAARIAGIILQAAYDVGFNTYKGFEQLGLMNPWAAGMHFTAAGLAAALAAGDVASAASGGGGGASMGARERAQGAWTNPEPEKGEGLTIIIQAGVLTGSDAGKEILNAIRDHDDAWAPGRTRQGMS